MKLLLMSVAQAMLGVGGMALLTNALGGKEMSFGHVAQAILTPTGIFGVLLMLTSGVVMFFIFTFAKLSEYVPISTAAAFFFTVIVSVMVNNEKVSMPLVLGMVLILGGMVLISRGGQ